MQEIEVPDVPPAPGGLLAISPPLSGTVQQFYQGVRFEGNLGGHNLPVPAPGVEKTFEQTDWVEGVKFQTYRGIERSMFEHEQALADVRKAFELGEAWAVERGVQEALLNPRATDITPVAGTALTKRLDAIGRLEQYAADNILGKPTFHTNRYGASLLDPEVDDNGLLSTKQGTPVVNGGGYGPTGPGGVAAPDGTAWVYVTGQVVLWRQQFTVNEQAHGLKENRTYVLAEATYLAAADGPIAAILVGS